MNQLEYQHELMSFDEKIELAELEVAKAQERVKELRYQKARFNLDFTKAVLKAQQDTEPQSEEKKD